MCGLKISRPRKITLSDRRRRGVSGRVTQWFRLLRVHGLIRKVSTTRYDRIIHKGYRVMSIVLNLRQINLPQIAA